MEHEPTWACRKPVIRWFDTWSGHNEQSAPSVGGPHVRNQPTKSLVWNDRFPPFAGFRWTGEGWTAGPIPPSLAPAKAFSGSGCSRIFPLLSRVMRVGLSTSLRERRLKGRPQGAEFSEAADDAILVFSLQDSAKVRFSGAIEQRWIMGPSASQDIGVELSLVAPMDQAVWRERAECGRSAC
jgi:hypothetical protein